MSPGTSVDASQGLAQVWAGSGNSAGGRAARCDTGRLFPLCSSCPSPWAANLTPSRKNNSWEWERGNLLLLVVATHPSCALGQKNPSADSQEINGWIISSAKSKSPVLSPLGQHLRGARALLCWLLQIGAGPESCGSNADLHQLKAVTVWHPASFLRGPWAGWPSVTVCH